MLAVMRFGTTCATCAMRLAAGGWRLAVGGASARTEFAVVVRRRIIVRASRFEGRRAILFDRSCVSAPIRCIR
ncbi:hypothetical protein WS86_21620 [Burkholderia savannae]|nr:hypothetical protein WS86_21620 [Burkholderia savannae]